MHLLLRHDNVYNLKSEKNKIYKILTLLSIVEILQNFALRLNNCTIVLINNFV